MADQTYRFRQRRPIPSTDLASLTGVAVQVMSETQGQVIDLRFEETNLQDVVDALTPYGFDMTQTNPSDTAADAVPSLDRVVLNRRGGLVVGRSRQYVLKRFT